MIISFSWLLRDELNDLSKQKRFPREQNYCVNIALFGLKAMNSIDNDWKKSNSSVLNNSKNVALKKVYRYYLYYKDFLNTNNMTITCFYLP